MKFNPEQITRMAREAEIGDSHGYIIRNELPNLTRFATLAADAAVKNAPDYKMGYADGAAAERNAFPRLDPVIQWLENGCDPKEAANELKLYAAAIRARGQS